MKIFCPGQNVIKDAKDNMLTILFYLLHNHVAFRCLFLFGIFSAAYDFSGCVYKSGATNQLFNYSGGGVGGEKVNSNLTAEQLTSH